MNLQQTTNVLKNTLSQIDELRENLEILKNHSQIGDLTYNKQCNELCEMESVLEKKLRLMIFEKHKLFSEDLIINK